MIDSIGGSGKVNNFLATLNADYSQKKPAEGGATGRHIHHVH